MNDALQRLVKLTATERNPHLLIAAVAADSEMVRLVRQFYEEKCVVGAAADETAQQLCRAERLPVDFFYERLYLLFHILNLGERSEDYYAVLQVSPTAGPQEIKHAYRTLSLASHPDTNPNDPSSAEKFQSIRRAYEILGNERLREHYDRCHAINGWEQTATVEEGLAPAVSRWRKPYLWILGGVAAILLLAVFAVDYQTLLTEKYYRAEHRRAARLKSTATAGFDVASESRLQPMPDVMVHGEVGPMGAAPAGTDGGTGGLTGRAQVDPQGVAREYAEAEPKPARAAAHEKPTILPQGRQPQLPPKPVDPAKTAAAVGLEPSPYNLAAMQPPAAAVKTVVVGKTEADTAQKLSQTSAVQPLPAATSRPAATAAAGREENAGTSPVARSDPDPRQPRTKPSPAQQSVAPAAAAMKPAGKPATGKAEKSVEIEPAERASDKAAAPPVVVGKTEADTAQKLPQTSAVQPLPAATSRPAATAAASHEESAGTSPVARSDPDPRQPRAKPSPAQQSVAPAAAAMKPAGKPATGKAEKSVEIEPAERASDKAAAPPVVVAHKTRPQAGEAPAVARPAEDAAAGTLTRRVEEFLRHYTQLYQQKDVGPFLRLFAADASENGQPVKRLASTYARTFDYADWIQYRIHLLNCSPNADGVTVKGRFRLVLKPNQGAAVESNGAIRLRLIDTGQTFRIKSLDYRFADQT